MNTSQKQFKVSFRLQSTAVNSFPIQMMLSLSTKDGDKYLRAIAPCGVSLKKNEWNFMKGRPVSPQLNSRLNKIEIDVLTKMNFYKNKTDNIIINEFRSGKFKDMMLDSICHYIHGQESAEQQMHEQIRQTSQTAGMSDYYNRKLNQLGLKIIDSSGNEVNSEVFFDIRLEETKPSPYIESNTEEDEEMEQNTIHTIKHIPFFKYIKSVGEAKVKMDLLNNPGIYNTLADYFEKFNDKITISKYTDKVSINFFSWLKPQMNTTNNFGKYIGRIKAVLTHAMVEDKYKLPDVQTKSKIYATRKEEVIHPYLSFEQLEALMKLEFTQNESKLELVRDLAIISSHTGGIRYSNWSQFFHVQSQKVKGKTVYFVESMSNKVGERKQIPIQPFIHDLIKKYEGREININDVDFNSLIKDVCKKAGQFNHSFLEEYIYYRKNLKTGKAEIVKKLIQGEHESSIPKLYQLVASHTMRRSFATNYYFEKKISADVLREFTGHSDVDEFMRYVKATSRQKFDKFVEEIF